jgi:acyl-CoA hydrolase
MNDTALAPRSPRDSITEMTEVVMPQHANTMGAAFGGTAMGWIDICAAIVARRHCGHVAVTAFVDDLEFLGPIRVGDLVKLTGRINAAFGSSMEIEVTLEREDPDTRTLTLCVEALLVFVHLDKNMRPAPVPPLLLETDEDRERYEGAAKRRAEHKARRKAKKARAAAPPGS